MASLSKDDVKVLQDALGVPADGILGPVTVKALQTKLGVKADGRIGPVTISALQSRLGVPSDGKWGPLTSAGIQKSAKRALGASAAFVVAPSHKSFTFDMRKMGIAALGILVAGFIAVAASSGKSRAKHA